MKAFLRALVVPVSVLMCVVAGPRGLSAQGTISLTQTFCSGTPCVLTYHNDNSRAGVIPHETIFSPTTNFTSHTAITRPTDGLIYAQPLYIKNLDSGGIHHVGVCTSPANIVFVATENNSVYAFDTSPPYATNPCWQTNLNQTGETAIPYTSLPAAGGSPCKNLTPQVGITGTPVIDVSVTPPILYVVSNHQKSDGTFAERLHAIDTTTGLELTGSPFDIGGALSGSGFKIIAENQRPGLALYKPSSNIARVYVAWASNCDYNTKGNYDGWVAGFKLDYSNLSAGFTLLGSFTSEPTSGQHDGGVWMAGSAPAIDSTGNVYVAVGNGDVVPPSQTSLKWGNSVLKLTPTLAYADFYTPNDYAQLNSGSTQGVCFVATSGQCPSGQTHALAPDTDMGTAGVVLLNNSSSPSELVSVGKQGMAYVIPYSASTNGYMGGLDGGGYTGTTGSNPQNTACSISTTFPSAGNIVQCFEATVGFDDTKGDRNGVWGAPAFWSANTQNQYLYTIGLHDYMYWYPYNAANSPPFATGNPVTSDHSFCGPNSTCSNPTKPVGGTVSVTWDSGNGGNPSSGLAWALDFNSYGLPNPNGSFPAQPTVLRAYKAVPDSTHCPTGQVCNELWDSTALPNSATVMPGAVKFTVPTIVDGYILVGGGSPGYFGTNSTACPPPPANPPFTCGGQLTILH